MYATPTSPNNDLDTCLVCGVDEEEDTLSTCTYGCNAIVCDGHDGECCDEQGDD